MTLMLLTLALTASAADTPATTEDGRKVVLHDDHTWSEAGAEPVAPTEPGAPKTCDDLVATDTDKMSGRTSTSTKAPLIVSEDGKTGLVIMAFTGSNSLIWSVKAIGASSCIDDDAKALVLFTDGSRLELENDSKFNCDGSWVAYFGGSFGKKKEQRALSEKEIDAMRVWTHDGFVERTFTEEQRADLRQSFACLGVR